MRRVASPQRNCRLGKNARGNWRWAKWIIVSELSMPSTDPSGMCAASSAATFPSPQPMSRPVNHPQVLRLEWRHAPTAAGTKNVFRNRQRPTDTSRSQISSHRLFLSLFAFSVPRFKYDCNETARSTIIFAARIPLRRLRRRCSSEVLASLQEQARVELVESHFLSEVAVWSG